MTQIPTYEELVHKVNILEQSLSELENKHSKNTTDGNINLALLENSPVCTKIVDTDYNLQYMSSSGVNSLNIDDISEFYGTPYPLTFYPDEFKSKMIAKLELAKKTGNTQTLEGSVDDLDGNTVWFHSTIVPVNNAEGELDYFMVVSMDITEQKQFEHELQESSSLLSSIINSPDNMLMFALDKNYNYLSFNKAHAKEMKYIYNTDIELGKQIFSYMTNEDDIKKATDNYRRVLKGERFVKHEEYGELENRLWYELIFNPIINNSNQITGFSVFCINTTERMLLEENLKISDLRLKMLVKASGIVIWDWNISTNELDWDDAYYQTFGYSKEDTLPTLESWTDFIHPDDTKQTLDSLYKVVESGEKMWVAEYRFKYKNESYAFTQDWGTVIHDASEKPVRMIGIMLDITEQKLVEDALRASEDRYRVLFDSSPDGILVAEKVSRKFLYANPTICDLLGYSESELTSMSVLDIHSKDSLDYVLDEFELQTSGKKLVAENIPCQ